MSRFYSGFIKVFIFPLVFIVLNFILISIDAKNSLQIQFNHLSSFHQKITKITLEKQVFYSYNVKCTHCLQHILFLQRDHIFQTNLTQHTLRSIR